MTRNSHRRACAYKPHKFGEKQFDSRSSDPYWIGSTRTLNDKGLEQSAAPYYEDNAAAHGLITSDYVDRVLH